MSTFMLKSGAAFKTCPFDAKCTNMRNFFSRKEISPLSAYNEMVSHSFIKGVVHPR